MQGWDLSGGIVKAWVDGVPVEDEAVAQIGKISRMPFIFKHVAIMPDVHLGKGATVGSVIATKGAVIPAAVGVDIGCGMMAIPLQVETTGPLRQAGGLPPYVRPLTASDLPTDLGPLRAAIEKAVPHGRTDNGRKGSDRGAWGNVPADNWKIWVQELNPGFEAIVAKHPKVNHQSVMNHLGTLGTGNHFIELCVDEQQQLWVMLHSGSRGVGNAIGSYFIEKAKEDMRRFFINLPDADLAYLPEGTPNYQDYCEAIAWAQRYASTNRDVMMDAVLRAIRDVLFAGAADKPLYIASNERAVQCHHNYLSHERHFGENVLVTRKGAVSAKVGELGIIPGSMGAKSFIVRGKGNRESFNSCSHGAGRKMSRGEAKRTFTLEDHRKATQGVECRKDEDVIDETPGAYKSIDDVMAAQADLVDIVHTLKQVLCVKG